MPLTGSVVGQMMARFRYLLAYKKVKIKFKRAKKYFGFSWLTLVR